MDSWRLFENSRPNRVVEHIEGCEALVTNKVIIDEAVMMQAPQLKLICVAATGVNNIDLVAARDKGIMVCHVCDYATASVFRHCFYLILALMIRAWEYQYALAQGRWQASDCFCLLDYAINELAGKKQGIVGYGVLGQAMARLGRAQDMQILIAEQRQAKSRLPGATLYWRSIYRN